MRRARVADAARRPGAGRLLLEPGGGPGRAGAVGASRGRGGGAPLPRSEVAPLVAAQTRRTLADLPTTAARPGLLPPTNRWFSGLVFGDEPQPVFPLPLAFTIDTRSFGFGLPQVVTSADAIVGSHQRDVSVTVQGSDRAARLGVRRRVGDACRPAMPGGRRWAGPPSPRARRTSPTVPRAARCCAPRCRSPAAARPGPPRRPPARTPSGSPTRPSAAAGSRWRRAARRSSSRCPPATPRAGWPAGAVPLTGSATTWSVAADTVTTSVRYRTAGGTRTAYGVLPHQRGSLTGSGSCTLGSFPTVLGELTLCEGAGPTWTAPRQDGPGRPRPDRAGRATSATRSRPRCARTSPRARTCRPTATSAARRSTASRSCWRWPTRWAPTTPPRDAAAALTAALRTWTEPQGCARRAERCFVYDPEVEGRGRRGAGVRVGDVQRPPLPLRLLPLRRRACSPRTTRAWSTTSGR